MMPRWLRTRCWPRPILRWTRWSTSTPRTTIAMLGATPLRGSRCSGTARWLATGPAIRALSTPPRWPVRPPRWVLPWIATWLPHSTATRSAATARYRSPMGTPWPSSPRTRAGESGESGTRAVHTGNGTRTRRRGRGWGVCGSSADRRCERPRRDDAAIGRAGAARLPGRRGVGSLAAASARPTAGRPAERAGAVGVRVLAVGGYTVDHQRQVRRRRQVTVDRDAQ